MTDHAHDTKQGFLWKQEHLAPLPVPTGQPASDLMSIMWRKNRVYLDVGSSSMGAGWMTLHMGTVLFITVSIWVALNFSGVAGMTWVDFWAAPLLGACPACQ